MMKSIKVRKVKLEMLENEGEKYVRNRGWGGGQIDQ